MHAARLVALRHLLVDDAASRRHPLHVARANRALVTQAVAVLHGSGEHVGDGLDAAVGMPRKAGSVALGIVVPKVVQQKKRIEVRRIAEAKRAAQVHPGSFCGRCGLDVALDRTNRHSESLSDAAVTLVAVTSLETYRREEFPVGQEWIYFNHASTGPLPRRAAKAIQALAEGQMLRGGLEYRAWLEAVDGLRSAAARLIHAAPEEIAVTSNTSQGLSFIANGVRWRPGDIVVGVADEFPANYFPWARWKTAASRSAGSLFGTAALTSMSSTGPAPEHDSLAISYVQYVSGFRVDLDAVGEICRRHGCLFVVDAIQGLGPFPIDVKRSGIHALSSGGQKWLLSPEGTGFLYVDRELLPELDIVEFGWTNVAKFPEYSKDPTLRPDAGRFEAGTLNSFGCAGMCSSIELLLEVGVDRLSEQVNLLADRLYHGAKAKGYEPRAERDRASGSGIVSIRKEASTRRSLPKTCSPTRLSSSRALATCASLRTSTTPPQRSTGFWSCFPSGHRPGHWRLSCFRSQRRTTS